MSEQTTGRPALAIARAVRGLARARAPDYRTLADEDLMELVVGGDTRAFAVLYDRHAAVAYSLAYRICGRRAAAEEAVQEAFLAAWRGRASYQSARGGLRLWLLALVRNRAIDAVRHASVTTSRDVHDEGLSATLPALERTDDEVERRSNAELVRRAMAELPDDQQRVIELSFFGGFTHSEIAAMLDLPPGTVKGRMRLGLTKLRATLAEPGSVMVCR
jgi:RNA polymerase sigma-70 factor (ECF subfamily)